MTWVGGAEAGRAVEKTLAPVEMAGVAGRLHHLEEPARVRDLRLDVHRSQLRRRRGLLTPAADRRASPRVRSREPSQGNAPEVSGRRDGTLVLLTVRSDGYRHLGQVTLSLCVLGVGVQLVLARLDRLEVGDRRPDAVLCAGQTGSGVCVDEAPDELPVLRRQLAGFAACLAVVPDLRKSDDNGGQQSGTGHQQLGSPSR